MWLVRYLIAAGLMRATPPWLWLPLPVITLRYGLPPDCWYSATAGIVTVKAFLSRALPFSITLLLKTLTTHLQLSFPMLISVFQIQIANFHPFWKSQTFKILIACNMHIVIITKSFQFHRCFTVSSSNIQLEFTL